MSLNVSYVSKNKIPWKNTSVNSHYSKTFESNTYNKESFKYQIRCVIWFRNNMQLV